MPTNNNCNCVRITYKFIGEAEVIVDVTVSGENDGKNTYNTPQPLGGSLFWTSGGFNGAWLIVDGNEQLQAILQTQDDCPFGVWDINPEVFESFNVTQCCPPIYELTSCFTEQTFYSSDPRLEDLIGKTIKLEHLEGKCFTVGTTIEYSYGDLIEQYTDFTYTYNTCEACRDLDFTTPNFDTCGCPAEKVEKVTCTFVDMLYQQMMSRRLGTDFCCPIERDKTVLQLKKLEIQLLCTDTPDFPEPEIIECCIVIPEPCNCPPTTCGCNTCEETIPVTTPDCNCTSSGENSPHDCHKYTVTTTLEQLGLAIGNTNTALNNKVFFCYFPCKNENPLTVSIKTATQKEYCVLGIPLYGYYANNVFVPIVVTRGIVCEPPVNTCN